VSPRDGGRHVGTGFRRAGRVAEAYFRLECEPTHHSQVPTPSDASRAVPSGFPDGNVAVLGQLVTRVVEAGRLFVGYVVMILCHDRPPDQ
jgi:hypothetical protein